MHKPKQKRFKWDKIAEKGIVVCYPENVKGYRVYIPIIKDVTTSRDVILIEKYKQLERALHIEETTQSETDATNIQWGIQMTENVENTMMMIKLISQKKIRLLVA